MNFIEKRGIQNLIEDLQIKNKEVITDEVANLMFHFFESNGKNYDENRKEIVSMVQNGNVEVWLDQHSISYPRQEKNIQKQKEELEKEKERLVQNQQVLQEEPKQEVTNGKKLVFTNPYVTSGKNGFVNLLYFIFMVSMSGFCCLMYMINMILMHLS